MSGLTVMQAGDDETTSPQVRPQSPLAILRGKRQALEASLHIDLEVPRWADVLPGHRLWVRYRPASPGVLAASIERRERKHGEAIAKGGPGDPDRAVKANADVLVAACVAVYDWPADARPPEDLPEGLPTFASEELSDAIGAPHNAVETARKLYVTQGDLLLAANKLMEWSGRESEDASQVFLGA